MELLNVLDDARVQSEVSWVTLRWGTTLLGLKLA